MESGGFEWDPAKNRANRRKHGIGFEDAATIFGGSYVEGPDERSDYGEDRFLAFGQMGPYVVAVVFCLRPGRRRIISARKATRPESEAYWEVVHGDT